jgi:hypothetical protein
VSYESCLAVGWGKIGPKGTPLLILYAGETVEPGIDAINAGLDSGVITSGRLYRGSGLAGSIFYNASVDNRPPNPGQLFPAGASDSARNS